MGVVEFSDILVVFNFFWFMFAHAGEILEYRIAAIDDKECT